MSDGARPAGGPARDADVVIVGAGVSGLAIAHAIKSASRDAGRDAPTVTLLEAADHPGGKVLTLREEGFVCEWGPAGFLDNEPATLELCDALGLETVGAGESAEKRYLVDPRARKLRPLGMSPQAFVATPLLTVGAKLRLMCEPLVPPRKANGDESVASFARRRIGRGAFETLIDAMQSGIYAGDPHRLSVASCFPKIVALEKEHGGLVRGLIARQRQAKREGNDNVSAAERASGPRSARGGAARLTSFRGGMSDLCDALARDAGDALRLGCAVQSIARGEGAGANGSNGKARPYLVATDGETLRARAVVMASPAHAAARLLGGLDPQLADIAGGVEYAPMAVICLGMRREQVGHPLDGFGFLAPRHAGLRLLGSLFSSTIFDGRAPEGHVLLRVMIGGARDTAVLSLSDDELVTSARAELAPLLDLSGAPVFTRVFRHRRAIPQYNVGHGARLDRIDSCLERLPGMFISGNAYRGVSVNDCVKNARLVASDVLAHLR